ncbi:MAG: sigma-70 family RNA polymerase sigma factor, partial [Pirellulaceae bacterium]|nr:sigma-70 family RNA polymerase sigma factor [Pirellulaceae bacterium]
MDRPSINETLDRDDEQFVHLMARATSGDIDAQTDICSQYERQVRIVARVLLGAALRPHLDSMDLMQSVHKSLLMGLRDKRFDVSSPEKLVSLACTIVRRKVARKWRINRRQIMLDTHATTHDTLEATLHTLTPGGTTPMEKAALTESIQSLCEGLSDVERVMVQRRMEGFTTGEVAAELKIHPVAIRVRW